MDGPGSDTRMLIEAGEFRTKCKRCGEELVEPTPEALSDAAEIHDARCEGGLDQDQGQRGRGERGYDVESGRNGRSHDFAQDGEDWGNEEEQLNEEEQQIWQQMVVEDEVTFNEKLIEEREQAMTDMCREMRQVKELFGEVAELVADQGEFVTKIENSTEQANVRALKALETVSE